MGACPAPLFPGSGALALSPLEGHTPPQSEAVAAGGSVTGDIRNCWECCTQAVASTRPHRRRRGSHYLETLLPPVSQGAAGTRPGHAALVAICVLSSLARRQNPGERWLLCGQEGTGPRGLLSKAGFEEELPLSLWARWSPWGSGSLFPEAPGQDLSLLLAAPLNTGIMVCSNNINKYSSHRESLVFTVNSESKQRHRFVFYSLTPFIIPCFNRLPPGP